MVEASQDLGASGLEHFLAPQVEYPERNEIIYFFRRTEAEVESSVRVPGADKWNGKRRWSQRTQVSEHRGDPEFP